MDPSLTDVIFAPIKTGLLTSGVLLILLVAAVLISEWRTKGKRKIDASVPEPASEAVLPERTDSITNIEIASIAFIVLIILLSVTYLFMVEFSGFGGVVDSKVRPSLAKSGTYQSYYVVVDRENQAVPYDLYRKIEPGDSLRRGGFTLWFHHNGTPVAHEGYLFFLGLAAGAGLSIWLAFTIFVFKSSSDAAASGRVASHG